MFLAKARIVDVAHDNATKPGLWAALVAGWGHDIDPHSVVVIIKREHREYVNCERSRGHSL